MRITDKIKNYFLQKWTGYTYEQFVELEKSKCYKVAEIYHPILLHEKRAFFEHDAKFCESWVEEQIKSSLVEKAKDHVVITKETDPSSMTETLMGTLILQERA